jgi:hypothetical protein
MYLFPSPMCNYCVCVCVFFFCPLKKKRSFVICFDPVWGSDKKRFHRFKETLDARISVKHHKRSQQRQPQRNLLWSLSYRLLSTVTSSENLAGTPCRSSMLFKRVPRICWEISSWPEWTSTYQHDHQGWMVSGQETIFSWVQLFPFQFLIPWFRS